MSFVAKSKIGPLPKNVPAVARGAVTGRGPVAASATPLNNGPGGVQHPQQEDPFRNLAFRAGLCMLFIQMGVLSELIVTVLHINAYLLYIVGPPTMLGTLFTGGINRTMRHRAAWLWLGFVASMMLSIPFSSWVGGSVGRIEAYLEFSLPFLFVVGGLAVNWAEVRSVFTCMGAAGVLVIAAAGVFAKEDGGRIDMASASGSIGNANDLASHLILVLPFVLFIAMDRRRAAPIRWAMIVPALYAFKVLFGTASRGAIIALAAAFLFVLLRGSARLRVTAIAAAIVLAVSIPFFLHGNAAERLSSLFGAEHEEALESKDARSYLLKQSLIYTIQHPVFGVGMGQFSNYEGKIARAEGRYGNWHETHNAFTEVSSECGIPALLFFVLGIGSAFFSVNSVYGKARREGHTDIANACFCYLLSFVGYLVSITFLANAYRFYLPAMIGLAIATSTVAKNEMAARSVIQPPAGLPPARPFPVRARQLHPAR